jgi:hypothetical protein
MWKPNPTSAMSGRRRRDLPSIWPSYARGRRRANEHRSVRCFG